MGRSAGEKTEKGASTIEVVITDAKYRMTLAVLREALDAGHTVTLVQRDDGAPPLCFFADGAHRDVLLGAERYGDELLRLLASYGERPVLLPCGAETLRIVSERREEFERVCRVLCPERGALALCNDKARIRSLAEQAGLPVPRELRALPGEDVEALAGRAPYPCVIKYVCGEALGLPAEERYRIVRTREEFAAVYPAFAARGETLVQEYLEGDGYGVSLLMLRGGGVGGFVCHRRIRESVPTGGPSTCCESVFLPEQLALARELLRRAGFVGPAMVEFKGETFLEVNPRVWGTYPLTRAAESGFTEAWIRAAAGEGMPVPLTKPRYRLGVRMRYLVSDLIGAARYLRAGDRRGWGAVRDLFRRGVRDGVFEKGDRVNRAYLRTLLERRRQS